MKGMRLAAEKIVMIESQRVMWGDWDEKEAESLREEFCRLGWESERRNVSVRDILIKKKKIIQIKEGL